MEATGAILNSSKEDEVVGEERWEERFGYVPI
jgi:hypothetical protein